MTVVPGCCPLRRNSTRKRGVVTGSERASSRPRPPLSAKSALKAFCSGRKSLGDAAVLDLAQHQLEMAPSIAGVVRAWVREIHLLASRAGYDVSHSEPRWPTPHLRIDAGAARCCRRAAGFGECGSRGDAPSADRAGDARAAGPRSWSLPLFRLGAKSPGRQAGYSTACSYLRGFRRSSARSRRFLEEMSSGPRAAPYQRDPLGNRHDRSERAANVVDAQRGLARQ